MIELIDEAPEIISSYTSEQAVEDGVLAEIMKNTVEQTGKRVFVTRAVIGELDYPVLVMIWEHFWDWKKRTEMTLPEEDRLFVDYTHGKKIWVIEDADRITIMYPEDY